MTGDSRLIRQLRLFWFWKTKVTLFDLLLLLLLYLNYMINIIKTNNNY